VEGGPGGEPGSRWTRRHGGGRVQPRRSFWQTRRGSVAMNDPGVPLFLLKVQVGILLLTAGIHCYRTPMTRCASRGPDAVR
jgi:hypothetical protein